MYNLINARRRESQSFRQDIFGQTPYVKKLYGSILEFVGNTPLIKLNKIPKSYGLKCEIYAKCEYMNPGGSIKDRIGLSMMKDAEDKGYVTENTTFVEPTSGNTGIGVAFDAALKGKPCTIVIGDKNSNEKVSTMRILGADVIMTNKSTTAIARKIKETNKDVIMLDQFENDVNPRTHYDSTGIEILNALDEIDMVVMGAGTGGTITGVGYRVKEKNKQCIVIAAEPDGSTMFNKKGRHHPYLVEGIGSSSVPIVLDASIVDGFEVVNDEEAFLMAREIISKEGLLCGGSSGVAVAAAVKAAKKHNMGAGKRIVVVLPDGIRNYMSKFVTDQWMEAHLFLDPPVHTMKWWDHPITNLSLTHKYPIIDPDTTCSQALNEMQKENIAVVVDETGLFIGAISKDSLRNKATNPTKLPGENSEDFNFEDPVSVHLVKDCFTLAINGKKGMPTIGRLSRILDITPFVVIGVDQSNSEKDQFKPNSVATAEDVLDYILKCEAINVLEYK